MELKKLEEMCLKEEDVLLQTHFGDPIALNDDLSIYASQHFS
jgi:hypothetical protein